MMKDKCIKTTVTDNTGSKPKAIIEKPKVFFKKKDTNEKKAEKAETENQEKPKKQPKPFITVFDLLDEQSKKELAKFS